MNIQAARSPIFIPDAAVVEQSQMTKFKDFCEEKVGRVFTGHATFHQFSIQEYRLFWRLFLDWSVLRAEGDRDVVCTNESCEKALFFPDLRLNYAENLLRLDNYSGERPALTACHPRRPQERLNRAELLQRVISVGQALRRLGVVPGDRIVAIAYNNAEIVIFALATASIGVTLSTAAPEMGASAILARFKQLAPKLLACNLTDPLPSQPLDRSLTHRIAEVLDGLSGLTAVIAFDDGPQPPASIPFVRLGELYDSRNPPASWPTFPFNHPLFILFSSGTTGVPKCLIHGAGGTLLEHTKEHRLHCDLRAGDKLLFHTSSAWMMWNWQLSSLASGVELVLYDGPISNPDTLWALVAREEVTVFGTSPSYLQLSETAGLSPGKTHEVGRLRAILSTGSILYDRQYEWARDHVKALPLQSISGGTDIIGCFVLGNPNLPVYRGESQCRTLGYDVESLGPAAPYGIGELVCRNPFPSRPIGLYGDADGSQFHQAYFSQNEGVWTQGDFIEFTIDGSARLHGRSDGVLKVRGIRIGPAEIYRIVLDIAPIKEALAVAQKMPVSYGDDSRLVLLVVLHEGAELDAALIRRIRMDLSSKASRAHVPAAILEVSALPVTHNGKLSERAAADAVNGLHPRNLEALQNPECLTALRNHPALALPSEPAAVSSSEVNLESQLKAIWEQVFQLSPIAPDDDFFDLGGHSLLAFMIVSQIRALTGRDLPLAALIEAPTIKRLAAYLRRDLQSPFPCLVRLKDGDEKRPLFIVHSVFGNVVDLKLLAAHLRTHRAVYALQPQGLDPSKRPHQSVGEMARHYISEIRSIQPTGPYALAGHSFGGLVAYEMARHLDSVGEEMELVALIDAQVHERNAPWWVRGQFQVARFCRLAETGMKMPLKDSFAYATKMISKLFKPFEGRSQHPLAGHPGGLPRCFEETHTACLRAMHDYRVPPYRGRIDFFRIHERESHYCNPLPVWARAAGQVCVHPISGRHATIMFEPHVKGLAEQLDRCLTDVMDRPLAPEFRTTGISDKQQPVDQGDGAPKTAVAG